jgi:hypothetical protein
MWVGPAADPLPTRLNRSVRPRCVLASPRSSELVVKDDPDGAIAHARMASVYGAEPLPSSSDNTLSVEASNPTTR